MDSPDQSASKSNPNSSQNASKPLDDKEEFVLLVEDVIDLVEKEQRISLVLDRTLCGEAYERAQIGLGNITGIPSPDEFKVAAEHAFWIRKLKPCRVEIVNEKLLKVIRDEAVAGATSVGLDPDKVGDLISCAIDKAVPEKLENDEEKLPVEQFINELVAVRIATNLLQSDDIYLTCEVDVYHDLVATLRYNSMSPGSLRLVLEAMNPPELDVRPTLRYHEEKSRKIDK